MAIIKPFRALHYNTALFNDISDLTAPPYDIITPEAQNSYYLSSEYNIIRLILGKETATDSPTDNVYTRAAQTLAKWRADDILVRDRASSYYMYELRFRFRGKAIAVRGFIGRVKLEDLDQGSILPHEKTLQKPKDDRLEVLAACRTNLSQIYGLYSDSKNAVSKIFDKAQKTVPLINAISEDGVIHNIYPINDKIDIEKITSLLKDKEIFIADGHHRYETALAFRNREAENRKLASNDNVNFTMMMLVNMDGENLTVLPTHRLLRGLTTTNPRLLRKRIEPYFEITPVPCEADGCRKELTRHLRAQRKSAFGLYLGQGRCYLLRLLDFDKIDFMIDRNYSSAWRHLDVTILQEVIIENLLGFSATELEPKNLIKFVKEEELAFRFVDEHEFQIAFLLNPTKISELKEIAQNRERMPQKSTHFYPKLRSGLLLNPLD